MTMRRKSPLSHEVYVTNACFRILRWGQDPLNKGVSLMRSRANLRAVRQGTGWRIQLDNETYAKVKSHQVAGETVSDTILRLLKTAEGSIQ